MRIMGLKEEFVRNMPIITVGLDSDVETALHQMRKHKIHHLVVTSPEGVLGVVSDRQIFDKAWTSDGQWDRKLTMNDVYTHLDECLSDSSDISQALELMMQTSSTALPIVRSGKLVGIVSETDVIRVLHNWLKSTELTAEARSQLLLSNPLVANLLQILAEAGI
jgi:CBS domain-containing protein